MKNKFLKINFSLNYIIPRMLVLVLTISFSQNVFGQEKTENPSPVIPKAKLITSSPYSNSEVESLSIDLLRNEVNRNFRNRGLIIIYCGKTCQYGEIEAHLRGINLSLRGKGLKDKQFLVLQGGYREEFGIEYWLMPENACLPIPDSTIDIKDVKFKGTYKRKFVAYDCC
jgi:hypothetical protein